MGNAKLEELILNCMDVPARADLEKLTADLVSEGQQFSPEDIAAFDVLWESWEQSSLDPDRSKVCLAAASAFASDSPALRKLMPDAMQVILPPYLRRPPVSRAVGVRDAKMPLRDIAFRIRKLQSLVSGTVVYMADSGWRKVDAVDGNTASVSLSAWGGDNGGRSGIALEHVLSSAVIFKSTLRRQEVSGRRPSAAEFRALLSRHAVFPLRDTVMRTIAAASPCCAEMPPDEFEKYWNESAAPATAAPSSPAVRRACASRSINEMDILLDREKAAGAGLFSADEQEELKKFFSRLNPQVTLNPAQKNNLKLFSSVVARVASRMPEEIMGDVFAPLLRWAPFFPALPLAAKTGDFQIWSDLAAKDVDDLSRAVKAVFGEEHLALMALRMPFKGLSRAAAFVDADLLDDLLVEHRLISADVMVWIWRKAVSNKNLKSRVTFQNISRSLAGIDEDVPQGWRAARRDLRELLLGTEKFQTLLIENAGKNVESVSGAVQSAFYLTPGGRQMLLAKLAGLKDFPELKAYIEGGAGARIMQAAGVKTEVHEDNGVDIVSISSRNAKQRELDNIINVEIPRNREAVKTARAHGDLSENAEFDAAKKERSLLRSQRAGLERELAQAQPVRMAQVAVDGEAVIGSQVTLNCNGDIETYFLLGAWDSDPKRNYVSYRAPLGKVLLNSRSGDKIKLPDGRSAGVTAVTALPPEVIAELDD